MKMSFRAKRLDRQNQRLAQSGKLNLVALMDIFTILVFFLMVNQSEVKVLQSNKEISLPRSVSEQLPTEKVMLTITGNGILVQGKPVWQGDWQQDSSRIISVRYYALLRARQPDPAYTNQQRYEMGSKQFDAAGDHYRRLLVSSTIYFHNAAL